MGPCLDAIGTPLMPAWGVNFFRAVTPALYPHCVRSISGRLGGSACGKPPEALCVLRRAYQSFPLPAVNPVQSGEGFW